MLESPASGEFRCQDRWLAAALIVLGLPLLRTEERARNSNERPGSPWTIFILGDQPGRLKWVEEYRRQVLCLPVADLRTAYNRLRNLNRCATSGAGRGGAQS